MSESFTSERSFCDWCGHRKGASPCDQCCRRYESARAWREKAESESATRPAVMPDLDAIRSLGVGVDTALGGTGISERREHPND